MNKKRIVALSAVVVVLILVSALVAYVYISQKTSSDGSRQSRQSSSSMLRFSDLQEKYPQNPKNCLASVSNSELKFDLNDKTNITNLIISNIIDIPAGTNVNVNFKTYDNIKATGTSVYESTYGTYNFVSEKDNAGEWKVTEFEACKP